MYWICIHQEFVKTRTADDGAATNQMDSTITSKDLCSNGTNRAHSISLAEAFRYWLKLGFVSFGGQAGQISMMHQELVERRKGSGDWVICSIHQVVQKATRGNHKLSYVLSPCFRLAPFGVFGPDSPSSWSMPTPGSM